MAAARTATLFSKTATASSLLSRSLEPCDQGVGPVGSTLLGAVACPRVRSGHVPDCRLDHGESGLCCESVIDADGSPPPASRRPRRLDAVFGALEPRLEREDRGVISYHQPRLRRRCHGRAVPRGWPGNRLCGLTRLPVLGERTREVETREDALLDEDLANSGAGCLLHGQCALELALGDEPELHEDLTDRPP